LQEESSNESVLILLVENYNSTVDLTESVMKEFRTSFHFKHQLAKKLIGVFL
jgi:hypothetical protein